ncbi:MAG: hypothetical protein JG782_1277 [Anaerophaga sp.]|uniref:DUF6146 family protein n=1 Tax=Anaerophaga thermohalophila TaxID=177400 RepID=UPI000237BE47|nr:DUF6146 family protein [Anaerophaga thermohalophila]MBZ4676657.1 hypothetical protein [Anaerophaga sp.]MDK2841646.1 hypothetical protein [Anaerophaga sp.]
MIMNKTNLQKRAFSLIRIFFIVLLTAGFAVSACKTTKKAEAPVQKIKLVAENDTTQSKDSVEYELIVLDPKFDSWLATQPPANYYSQQYYENWNQRYVTEWNQRHDNPIRYGNFYETRIDYQPNIDYGLELNYKLYYYFRFIEQEYGIVLVRRGK